MVCINTSRIGSALLTFPWGDVKTCQKSEYQNYGFFMDDHLLRIQVIVTLKKKSSNKKILTTKTNRRKFRNSSSDSMDR